MSGLALHLLGPVTVTVEGKPLDSLHIRPALALLIYLACRPERHRREQLMALLWPDWLPAAAQQNLRQNLYVLRRALPTIPSRDGHGPVPPVLADRETMQLNPVAAVEVDAQRFTSWLQLNTAESLDAAVTLYRGDFLADLYLPDSAPWEEWAATMRADLRRRMMDALERLADDSLDRKAFGEAAAYARRQLEMDNLRESAYRQLMRALASDGRRVEALAEHDRCARLLRDELGLEPSAETRSLADCIAGDAFDLASLDSFQPRAGVAGFVARPRHNLPQQLTSFIGRETEIEAVRQLVVSSRLVTLTGAGGCGKSRLSLEVANRLPADFDDGVWLAELAPLANPDLVPETVAFALGLRNLSDRPIQDLLVDYLRPRNVLLILDNCEHLIEALATLCDSLLRACPRLHILATSREGLAVRGETAYIVPSMEMPDPERRLAPAELAAVESVRLFVERAAAVQPGFDLTETNGKAIAQICRRLDGIPLAIELAAARIKTLSAAQIAQRLDDRFRLLTGGSRAVLPRQQTLRATIDWSYDLLSGPERLLFCRLAVFRGGWTLDAAEAVCTGPDLTGFQNLSGLDILDLLAHLVDKSLVMVEEHDGETRYSRLETIRQYGCEKLLESGEGDWARRRHLDYFLDFAKRGDYESRGPRSFEWKRRTDAEHSNLRAALQYAFDTEGASEAVVHLIRAVGGFNGVWSTVGWKEGHYWSEKALAHPNALSPTVLRARLLDLAAIFDDYGPWERRRSRWEESLVVLDEWGESARVERAYVLMWLGFKLCYQPGERENGTRHIQEAIRIFEDSGDRWGLGFTLNLYSEAIADLDNDFNAACAVAARGMEVARQTGEQFLIAVFDDNFGMFNVRYGRFSEGQGYLHEALAVYRQFQMLVFACQVLRWLGDAARGLNDYETAEAYYRESLAMVQEIGWLSYGIYVRLPLGLTVLHQGDVQQALQLFTEALEVAFETSKPEFPRFPAFFFLDGVAAALAVQGRADAAARLYGAFDAHTEALLADGFSRNLLFDAIGLLEHEHFLSLCRDQLDEATFASCWSEGRALTLAEAVEVAQSCGQSTAAE
jgi:predicted ATPase/DNA-binding SARP family transcriptional activator